MDKELEAAIARMDRASKKAQRAKEVCLATHEALKASIAAHEKARDAGLAADTEMREATAEVQRLQGYTHDHQLFTGF